MLLTQISLCVQIGVDYSYTDSFVELLVIVIVAIIIDRLIDFFSVRPRI